MGDRWASMEIDEPETDALMHDDPSDNAPPRLKRYHGPTCWGICVVTWTLAVGIVFAPAVTWLRWNPTASVASLHGGKHQVTPNSPPPYLRNDDSANLITSKNQDASGDDDRSPLGDLKSEDLELENDDDSQTSKSTDDDSQTSSTEMPAGTCRFKDDGLERAPNGTLVLEAEAKMVDLFRNVQGQTKFEASDVVLHQGRVYVVFDSSWAIAQIHPQLIPMASENLFIGDPFRIPSEESEYEALFFDEMGTLYVIREALPIVSNDEKTSYHAMIEELEFDDTGHPSTYQVVRTCASEFDFDSDNKGFEGAVAIRDLDNELMVLALCEANRCLQAAQDETGQGRIVVMKRSDLEDGSCVWTNVQVVPIPSRADFADYSALALDQESGRVAITSQMDSQLYVGQLMGRHENGRWNITELEFDEQVGDVYDFPLSKKCHTKYCNIEGVHWVDSHKVIVVSDKAKKHKQDKRCKEKDQAVHIFSLPPA